MNGRHGGIKKEIRLECIIFEKGGETDFLPQGCNGEFVYIGISV